MRQFLQFVSWASGCASAAMLAGSLLVGSAQANAVPAPVDCNLCGCSSVTKDCVSTQNVPGCKAACDCTGLIDPECGMQ